MKVSMVSKINMRGKLWQVPSIFFFCYTTPPCPHPLFFNRNLRTSLPHNLIEVIVSPALDQVKFRTLGMLQKYRTELATFSAYASYI
uniref:Putative ovule protein n=1 Tax=Solanum chacoense TaxID=4108 RepID=A0A0V0HII8_SOLCH